MIRTTLNWTVKNLKAMHDGKNTLQMDHVIQRQSGQWEGDKLKKSLLIHSMLANYPVPPIYCLKEPADGKDYSYSVLDGKQRLTTIFDYIDGRYPLDAETPDVVLDGTSYELGCKYFTDLDMECQQEILRFKFTIYGFEDADDDLIEEIFYRLNNSTPLSKPQKSMALTGVQNAAFIKSLLSDRFFSEICKFSALQRRKSDDMCTLLQSMMLLDSRHSGYEYASISADEIMRYAAYIKNNYSEEQKERLFNIIDYLEKVFPEQDKMLKKINIPIVILAADLAMGSNYNAGKNIYRVGPMYFRQWFSYFFAECYENYKQYCSSGSIKKEKTLKRIEIMERSLAEYFDLEKVSRSEQENEILTEPESSSDNTCSQEEPVPSEAELLSKDFSSQDGEYTSDEAKPPSEDISPQEAERTSTETESLPKGDTDTGNDATRADGQEKDAYAILSSYSRSADDRTDILAKPPEEALSGSMETE